MSKGQILLQNTTPVLKLSGFFLTTVTMLFMSLRNTYSIPLPQLPYILKFDPSLSHHDHHNHHHNHKIRPHGPSQLLPRLLQQLLIRPQSTKLLNIRPQIPESTATTTTCTATITNTSKSTLDFPHHHYLSQYLPLLPLPTHFPLTKGHLHAHSLCLTTHVAPINDVDRDRDRKREMGSWKLSFFVVFFYTHFFPLWWSI